MDPEHLQVLRMESEARNNPLVYRTKVLLLGLLGYAFIFLVLLFSVLLVLLVLALIVGACYTLLRSPALAFNVLKLLIPGVIALSAFTLYILRALWVVVELPEGIEIERSEAVPLFQEIDRLRGQLRVPRFHRVLITNDFNAAVYSRPRLGLFGFQEYSLLLGVPLMASLSPDQFRAVLAHEMGHISASQGRFNGWVYRLWDTYLTLLHALLQDGHGGAGVFVSFFSWYAPLFDRYSFALRRLDEYEADQLAAKAVGARTVADALLAYRLVVRSWHEENSDLTDHRLLQRWGNEEMESAGNAADTHPSLAARLRALGQPATAPEPPHELALMRYLGHRAPLLAQSVGIQITFSSGDPVPAAEPSSSAMLQR